MNDDSKIVIDGDIEINYKEYIEMNYKEYFKINVLYNILEQNIPVDKQRFIKILKTRFLHKNYKVTYSPINYKTFVEMKIAYNAVKNGWSVKKIPNVLINKYVYSKDIEGKQEVYLEKDFTNRFIHNTMTDVKM